MNVKQELMFGPPPRGRRHGWFACVRRIIAALHRRARRMAMLVTAVMLANSSVTAQGAERADTVPDMDLDQLVNIEFTSAGKKEQKLSEVAAAAHILVAALEKIPGPPTREAVVNALEGLGETLRLGPKDHRACHRIWPTILRDGTFVPFAWRDIAGLLPKESRS